MKSGTQLGPYKIVAPLGRGGMGEVYRAKDTRLDREVAIKVLPDHLAADPDALKRFEREAKAVAALSHPNILTIHDVGSEQGVSFEVMELLEGETLRTVISGKPVPWRNAVEFASAIAEGLAAAHSKGVIHRDLKPENVFITSDDRVKILDFGLARYKPQLSPQELTEAPTESKLTESGIVMGTVPYMSPEQVRGESVDARTDIFSFGCVLYEMLTGKRVFHRGTSAETISAILRDEPPELPENIPAELSHIIVHCLEKNSAKRFQTAQDLLFALREVGAHGVRPTASGKWSRRTSAVVSAVVVLVAIIALVIGLRKQSPQESTVPKIQSLAVLPLKNLSGDPKQEYFSDGMTEELITTLGKIESLRVISRTSVMEYKGGHKKIPEIAKELNVDAVVEGSVLQAGDRVRITAQLIHAASDRQMWSEGYERDLRDILALQNEVARSIAGEIQIKLSPQEKAKLAEAQKVHPEAYNAYLRGMELWNGGMAKSDELGLSAEMFGRAVELDPNFALAYTQLSIIHSFVYSQYMDRTPMRLDAAKNALDHAFLLQPGMPEAHIALGYYYYRGFNDYDGALKEFTIARKSLPNDPLLRRAIADVRRRQGDFEACVNELKKLLDLSPRDPTPPHYMGQVYTKLRRYAEADGSYNRAISLAPDQNLLYFLKAWNYILWKGDIGKAKLTLEKSAQKNAVNNLFDINIITRDFEEALKQVSSLSAEGFETYARKPKDQHIGEIYRFMNQPELSRKSFQAARIALEKEVQESPEQWKFHANLGITYAGLGLKEEAIREGKLATELLPVSKDAMDGTAYVERLAWIYVMVGEYDAALDQIEYLLSIPSWVSVPYLRIHPWWDPLRNHPRFQELLEKYEFRETK